MGRCTKNGLRSVAIVELSETDWKMSIRIVISLLLFCAPPLVSCASRKPLGQTAIGTGSPETATIVVTVEEAVASPHRADRKKKSAAHQRIESQIAKLEPIWFSGGDGKWKAWDQLRVLYGENGYVEEFIQGSQKAVVDGSPYWADYANYGNMVLNRSRNAAKEALRIYDAGLKRAPNAYILHTGRGTALLVLGERAEAIKAFETALSVAAKRSLKQDMYFMLATLHHENGDKRKAHSHYRRLESTTIESTVAGLCPFFKVGDATGSSPRDAGPNFPVTFIKDSLVTATLGFAAFQIHQKRQGQAAILLRRLIDCGLPRQELTKFSLDKLIARHKMKL